MKILTHCPVKSGSHKIRDTLIENGFRSVGYKDEECLDTLYNDNENLLICGHNEEMDDIFSNGKIYDICLVPIRLRSAINLSLYYYENMHKKMSYEKAKSILDNATNCNLKFCIAQIKKFCDFNDDEFDVEKGYTIYKGNDKIKRICFFRSELLWINGEMERVFKDLDLDIKYNYSIVKSVYSRHARDNGEEIRKHKNKEYMMEHNEDKWILDKYFKKRRTLAVTLGIGEKYEHYARCAAARVKKYMGLDVVVINDIDNWTIDTIDKGKTFEIIQSSKFFLMDIIMSYGFTFQQWDRIMYFDCDWRPVKEWDVDALLPHVYGNAYHVADRGYITHVINLEKRHKLQPGTYVNAGWFLYGKEMLNDLHYAVEQYHNYDKEHNEQCQLNHIMKNKIIIAPRKYNTMNHGILPKEDIYGFHDSSNYLLYDDNGHHHRCPFE